MVENKTIPNSWLSKYSEILLKIETALAIFSAIVTVLLMILVDANVLGRYTLNLPVPGAVEVSILLLAMLLITAQPWVQTKNVHLRLDFIIEHVPVEIARIIQLAVFIVSLIFCVAWAWGSTDYTIRSWGDAFFGLIAIPFWPALLVIPISIIVICLRIPIQIYQEIISLRGSIRKRG
jgi:TRAP-type C4-dicarboxylate transport system permease small subunit